MRFFIVIATIFFALSAHAGKRSCTKLILEITKNPRSEISLSKKMKDRSGILFEIPRPQMSDAQQDLFEKIQDCMAQAGSHKFEVWVAGRDGEYKACDFYPLHGQWKCVINTISSGDDK